MFNKAHIATRGTAMTEQVRAMVAAWRDGEHRDVYADMNDLTLATFLVALFGTDLPEHLQTEFTALMPAIMKGTIRQTVLPSWITTCPCPPTVRTRHASPNCAPSSTRPSAITKTPSPPAPPSKPPRPNPQNAPTPPQAQQEGLFATLLTAQDFLTRQQLQDEAITLLTGAIETTGTTLAWTL